MIAHAIERGEPADSWLVTRALRADRRLSVSSRELILEELARRPEGTAYGSELAQALGIANGTLYPTLDTMTRNGWLTVTQEDGDARQHKRATRKFVTITPAGRSALEEISHRSVADQRALIEHALSLYEFMQFRALLRCPQDGSGP